MRPSVLVVAPNAPPKLSAEAMQVRLMLRELDQYSLGMLVTTPIMQKSWVRFDKAMTLALHHYRTYEAHLPLHQFSNRLYHSRHVARFMSVSQDGWLPLCVRQVCGQLGATPDVIYTRAQPFSAALMGRALKRKLQRPWIMHLSDPWCGDDENSLSKKAQKQERACFNAADAISLTTQGQVDYYRAKFPHCADKLFLSPNMLPDDKPISVQGSLPASTPSTDTLRLVYTGALYGKRAPIALFDALRQLRAEASSRLPHIKLDVYGNADAANIAAMQAVPDIISYHGLVSYEQAAQAQAQADILVSADFYDYHSRLSAAMLPVKILNYIAAGKPVLGLAYPESETAKLCAQGYGYAVAPNDTAALIALLKELVGKRETIRAQAPLPPPSQYQPASVAAELMQHVHRLIEQYGAANAD